MPTPLSLIAAAETAMHRYRDLVKAHAALYAAGEEDLATRVYLLIASARDTWKAADAALPEWQRMYEA